MMQNGYLSAGTPRISRTFLILSSIGAMPIQQVPSPRDTASRRMFSTQAPMSCCHMSGTVISSRTPRGTMHSGALPAGPA